MAEKVSKNGVGKELYDYQKRALHLIFDKLAEKEEPFNLLFQLPTGGGKNRYLLRNSKTLRP